METHKERMRSYLCDSLRELMERNLFEKITIKQICDRAGVIRATFYNYFDDKYDCLDSIVYLDFSAILDDAENEKPEILLLRLMELFETHAEFYRRAFAVTGQNNFEDMLRKNLALFLCRYLNTNRRPDRLERYSNEYLSRYYAEGAAFHIREFLFQKEETLSAKDVAATMLDLMDTSLSAILR
jgi:AcrR family transcriptional regulator